MRGEQYLTRREQFARVYEKGKSWADALLVMKALPNELGISRYGFAVGKRVGTAVVRNRVKRLLREILRVKTLKPGMDIIFIARAPAAGSDFSSMKKSAEKLLGRAGLLNDNERVCLSLD